MPVGIYPRTKEHRQHYSEARKGHIVSEETREKLSKFFKGKTLSVEHRQHISESLRGNKYRLGKKDLEETRKKKSDAIKGKKHHFFGKKLSEEHKKKLKDNHKGTLGLSFSDETKRKMSKAQKGKSKNTVGEKNGMWKGGISQNPEHKRELKRIGGQKRRALHAQAEGSFTLGEWEVLKKQYGYTCPMCKKKEPEIKLTIDHIIPLSRGGSNYVENIQPLCKSCNSKKYTKIFRIISKTERY